MPKLRYRNHIAGAKGLITKPMAPMTAPAIVTVLQLYVLTRALAIGPINMTYNRLEEHN